MNFEHYVQNVRLEQAQQLLKNTGLSVLDIANMTGFSSSQYFCRVFQAALHTTPLRYRRAQIETITSKLDKRTRRKRRAT
jgi:transcriptional regulator GlxA family with amidase domain